MRSRRHTALLLLSAATLVTAAPGCDTTTGALSGAAVGAGLGALIGHNNPAAGALIGGAAGALAGGILGHINEEQQAKLREQSPQTLETIRHNDQVVANSGNNPPPPPPSPTQASWQPASSSSSAAAAPAAQNSQALMPLTVDDVKAMSSSGIKSQVIIDEIKTSQTRYTQRDVDTIQQAAPPVDPSVVSYMKSTVTG